MNQLRLIDIIGQTITDLRYLYSSSNDYRLQEFYSYLQLSSGHIIGIPRYDTDVLLEMNSKNTEYLLSCFTKGDKLSEYGKSQILNQKVKDIYFCYYDGEVDDDKSAYLELENGTYMTEINHGPQGLTDIDLIILDKEKFETRTKRLDEQVRSYKNEIKTFANIGNRCTTSK